jgi:hypothetical protein
MRRVGTISLAMGGGTWPGVSAVSTMTVFWWCVNMLPRCTFCKAKMSAGCGVRAVMLSWPVQVHSEAAGVVI